MSALKLTRKEFIKNTALAGGMAMISPYHTFKTPLATELPEIHVFSKHLQFLNYKDMAAAAADIGFDGVDLAVRPGGHVLPENVDKDLPKAVHAVENAGIKASMMTTSINDPAKESDMRLLETAADLGLKYYRMDWLSYKDDTSMPESIIEYQDLLRRLGVLNKKLGLIGCYQNHAGSRIGASIWEVKQLLDKADPSYMGIQYDIRHATVEGALSWENGLRLIQSRIKTLALKDFKWGKVEGRWRLINTPIGKGMIDFNRYFQLLKQYSINVPVSLHLEYPLGGAEHGRSSLTVDNKTVFQAMKTDLDTIKELWKSA